MSMLSLIPQVLAADPDPASGTDTGKIINITPKGSGFSGLANLKITQIIQGLITLALVVAAVVFFFMLVIGGIRWILSGGDKGQAEAARGQITAALIGLVIVFAAWAIGQLIATFFGIDIFSTVTIPSVLD